MRTVWTRIVPPSLTPRGLAIKDRPHGWSLRPWRSRVRGMARGGDHDAPSSRGTLGRALQRRSPRMVPLSLGVPVLSVGTDRRDCPVGELACGERSFVLRRADQMTLGRC